MLDVVVIGAGAAGLAASGALRRAGREVLTLEAKDRTGGRAHTDTATFGMPWDRGAHWLHDAVDNPMRAFADRLGIRYRREPRLLVIRDGSGRAVGAERKAAILAYLERAFAAVDGSGERGDDRPAAEVVPPHPEFVPIFDSLFSAFNGVEPARMSTLDHARSIDGENWPVVDGYGALLQRVAEGVPVRCRCPVRRIELAPGRVRIGTDAGTIESRMALVTVSTEVLSAGAIHFAPDLPAHLLDAVRALPLGEANKVAVAFSRNVFDREDPHFMVFENRDRETIRFDVRPARRHLALGYLGGSFARDIEAAGEEAMVDLALEHLVRACGSDLRRHVVGTACTGWCGDPEIRGGYSCARPGHAGARAALTESVAGRIHFAGEAASIGAYGTVHGAWQSGEAAAGRIAEALDRDALA